MLLFHHLAFEEYPIGCSKMIQRGSKVGPSLGSLPPKKADLYEKLFTVLLPIILQNSFWNNFPCQVSPADRISLSPVWRRRSRRLRSGKPAQSKQRVTTRLHLLLLIINIQPDQKCKNKQEKSDRAEREGAQWPEASVYRGVMGGFRLG